MYTLNLRIKKAATSEKTMGYGFNLFEKIWFYSKLTLEQSRFCSQFSKFRGWRRKMKWAASSRELYCRGQSVWSELYSWFLLIDMSDLRSSEKADRTSCAPEVPSGYLKHLAPPNTWDNCHVGQLTENVWYHHTERAFRVEVCHGKRIKSGCLKICYICYLNQAFRANKSRNINSL